MAILLAKSRTIISNILKITTNVSPFENILKQRCTKNHSWFHANLASYKTLAGDLVSGRPRGLLASSAAALTFRRPESARAGELAEAVAYTDEDEDEDEDEDDDANQGMDFPGGRVTFTPQMEFISESSEKRVPCYRVLDDDGYTITGSIFEQVDEEKAVKMYKSMVDPSNNGHHFLRSAKTRKYREPGILLWRGFTIQQFANQLFGTKDGNDKGRQMPVHYGSKQLNYFTISSPIATQLPQAAGVAYSLKMDNKEACVVAFMGDGCTSEAYGIRSLRVDGNDTLAVYSAISAAREMLPQAAGVAYSLKMDNKEACVVAFMGDGCTSEAYGIRSLRVDGNDTLAVYSAISAAREMVIREQKPMLVEALTYRVGHHSTSDDSTKYRSSNEIKHWKTARNPTDKFRKWVQKNGWWTEEDETELRSSIRKQVLSAVQVADKMEKPRLEELFTDVYDRVPLNLREQEKSLRETIKKHQLDFPADVPV
ncbi:2-oxoisovalerate dehydrogenase subunit alpha 2 mitochondrial [Phtheirospermum japonicum]|uniref:2-oxoisovalerate dehydrogenase subunit alpha 2 mitochondrial n=1 Tax=Phtheirospermum japonicum TaxID=374723 RepID=A0A830CP99_9LAMI|nr:2-oxoisovalerate dehydrogenase subunit alpha 2 mitochondrial [Phtheirospermum japonicum]